MHNPNQFENLGATMVGKRDDGTLIGEEYVGRLVRFPFPESSSIPDIMPLPRREVIGVICRNTTGQAIKGGRFCQLASAGLAGLEEVIGYGALLGQRDVILSSPWIEGNIPDDDLFIGILEGFAYVTLPDAGAGFNGDISAKDRLTCATASTTLSDAAGRAAKWSMATTATGQTVVDSQASILAMALSAATTGQTGQKLLVHIGRNSQRWS